MFCRLCQNWCEQARINIKTQTKVRWINCVPNDNSDFPHDPIREMTSWTLSNVSTLLPAILFFWDVFIISGKKTRKWHTTTASQDPLIRPQKWNDSKEKCTKVEWLKHYGNNSHIIKCLESEFSIRFGQTKSQIKSAFMWILLWFLHASKILTYFLGTGFLHCCGCTLNLTSERSNMPCSKISTLKTSILLDNWTLIPI